MKRGTTNGTNTILRRARVDDKNWAMEELARAAGVSAQTVRKAERGISISEISMAKIAKALGVPVAKLFPNSQ